MVIAQNTSLGANYILSPELRTAFPEDYEKYYLRTDADGLNHTLEVVTIITRQETRPEETTPASERLLVKLIALVARPRWTGSFASGI